MFLIWLLFVLYHIIVCMPFIPEHVTKEQDLGDVNFDDFVGQTNTSWERMSLYTEKTHADFIYETNNANC
jgi:hypothetical protein